MSSYLGNEIRATYAGELKGLSHQFKRAESGMVKQAWHWRGGSGDFLFFFMASLLFDIDTSRKLAALHISLVQTPANLSPAGKSNNDYCK